MNDKTIKPCPFCGKIDLSSDGHFLRCEVCGATGPHTYPIPDEKVVDALWNTRAEQEAKEEPLAVLADRKGVYIEWEANYEEEWHIGIDGVRVKQEDFKAPTYAAAEAKVRAYLAGLPDKEAA